MNFTIHQTNNYRPSDLMKIHSWSIKKLKRSMHFRPVPQDLIHDVFIFCNYAIQIKVQ